MDGLRVSAWKRHGKDRLYVNRAHGESVAWLDRRSGEVRVLVEAYRVPALEVLAPYLTQRPSETTAPSPPAPADPGTAVPPLPPFEYDLASRRPGESLQGKIDALSPGPFGRFTAWLLRRPTKADSWRAGAAGERIVAKELALLSRRGWRVLPSIPLPRINADIDHLLIGPGGVFTINTKNHSGKAVWVGDDSARINFGEPQPYVRRTRQEAKRVGRVLSGGCGFPVPVDGILVFVRPAKLTVALTLSGVRAIRDREAAALGPLAGVLSPGQIDLVYAVARDRRLWETA